MRVFAFSILMTLAAFADSKQDWTAVEKMKGEWVGAGSGDPGDGAGSFTFLPEMQGKVYVRKNHADYPATKDRPAFRHEDFMTVYQEGNAVKADYVDNEGHVIHYTVTASGENIDFVSKADAKGPRYRLRYQFNGAGKMKLSFDIAPPGNPDQFKNYIEAELRRK